PAWGPDLPVSSPAVLGGENWGNFSLRPAVRFFSQRSTGSMICESAETIRSSARTDCAVRAAAAMLMNYILLSNLISPNVYAFLFALSSETVHWYSFDDLKWTFPTP